MSRRSGTLTRGVYMLPEGLAGGLSWGEYKYEPFYLYETLPGNRHDMSALTCYATHQHNTGAGNSY